ncbi:hypothetical protein F4553_001653 [Allocatelliglobosispora scoriae]|uniref:Uncharacterized protein n=1 Tax=Allocatelliglobosispora scoriae TaxID=643052 RepID=A0A841BJ38_9ACTN|nr:hypothetical protein [Allocatelliglobosispora scoriae]MBB5868274.1 hypothetical protein [Allocatelliglobosispora scoriae]
MDHDELVGCWSSDHGYHSAMEDEWLVFRADGTGWSAYLRPWFTHAVRFRWSRTGPAAIRVEAFRETELDESDGDVVEHTELDLTVAMHYVLALGSRPLLAEPIPLLAIALPFLQLRGERALESRDEPERDFLRRVGLQQ